MTCHTESSCSNKEKPKRNKNFFTRPKERPLGENPALGGKDTGRGKEILQITREKLARKANYQSPIKNGTLLTIQPRLDNSGDAVVPCGVITESGDITRTAKILRHQKTVTQKTAHVLEEHTITTSSAKWPRWETLRTTGRNN